MTNDTQAVPCGKCPPCMARRVSGWSFRLMMEDKRAKNACFLTLTYDTDHVPISPNGYMTLKKSDVQLFFKRLRKSHGPVDEKHPIKYYAAGEYGGTTKRPHYHIILFNANPELILPAWGLGSIDIGHVSEASVGYTLKYINKPKKIPMHRNDDRLPEFPLMSKHLGDNYINDRMIQWHHEDRFNRMYCNIADGKKISMPRYYKQKIYTDEMRKAIGYHQRMEMVKKELETMEAEGADYWRNKSQKDLQLFRIQQSQSRTRDKM